jgi:beta-lactam-binding protein with PASTA domain
MPICPKCNAENGDDVDFCANCGNYLRWDPTRLQPAVKLPDLEPAAPAPAEPVEGPPADEAPAAAAPPPPAEPEAPPAVDLPSAAAAMRTMDMPVIRAGDPRPPGAEGIPSIIEPEAVQISLTYPELPGDEQKLVVEAGGRATLPAVIRNQSGIVDNYEIQVKGMREEWWNVVPPSVYLVPFGAPSGTYEEEVQINFTPPRSAEAEARVWEVEVVAVSRAQGEVAGKTPGRVEITPYEQLETELRPAIVSGRRRGEYALMVRNRANAPIDTVITGVDQQNHLEFNFKKPEFTADPGRRDGTTFTVKPKHLIWIGRPTDRRFEVSARGVRGESSARPMTGTFRQKPFLPWWLLIAAPAILAAAVFLYSLIPHKTTVPDLHGMTAATAALAIQKANLKAPTQPPAEVPSPTVAYLHVVRQNPSWHKGPVDHGHFTANKVKAGTVVTFFVAEPRVPNLVGATQAEAQKVLPGLKLMLGQPKVQLVHGKFHGKKVKIGTIISQSPPAQTSVAEGSTVTIVVAVGSGLRTVPNVVGQGIAKASALIKGAGLAPVLNPLPTGVNPTTAKISLQVPTALTKEKAGSSVTIYVNPPAPPKKPSASPTTTPVQASALAGLSAAAAAAQIKAAGANPVTTKEFNAAPVGTVVGTNPATVSKGATVQVIVSAGLPPLAFSDGSSIYVTSAVDGKGTKKIAASGQNEDEPSWQPNGNLIAYRRGPAGNADQGQIWTVDATKGATSARQMTAGPDDRRPAFSPDGKVIAFIRRTTSSSGAVDGDLCFVRTASTLRQGSCITDTQFNVDRPTWSPDGRAILVIANPVSTPNQIDVGEYTTARPFSSSPSDWVWQGLITDKMHPSTGHNDVIYAAFSPDGTQVALVANWTNNQVFSVYLAPWASGQLGTPKQISPTVRACEVAWRSDGGELVVTQADNGCTNAQGALVRVDPASAGTTTTIRSSASQNPTWKQEPTPS